MVSGNGRFVGFRSRANNLVPDDTNDALDVFVHDRLLGLTTRLSVSSSGVQGNAAWLAPSVRCSMFMSRPFLSANGRYAAFTSRAANLVADDTNGKSDVFVHDLWTGRTLRVSLTSSGLEAHGESFVFGIRGDGRVVPFTSLADNLVPGDTNGRRDVFVAWLRPAATSRWSPATRSCSCPAPGSRARGDGVAAAGGSRPSGSRSTGRGRGARHSALQGAPSSLPASPRKANSIRSTMVRRWWGVAWRRHVARSIPMSQRWALNSRNWRRAMTRWVSESEGNGARNATASREKASASCRHRASLPVSTGVGSAADP